MSPLPTGGGTAEQLVRYVIRVDDQGTPAFRRFSQESGRALQTTEQQSRAAFNAVGAGAEQATRKVEGLGRQMNFSRGQVQHLQHAFGILGFHLASAGSQAARATSAFAGLAIHGFSPVSLAIAGLAAGIGVLIMRHGEAEEAAKKHAEAERQVWEESRRGQVQVRGLSMDGGQAAARAAELEADIRQQDVRIADAQKRLDDTVARLKDARIRGLPVGIDNRVVASIREMTSQQYMEEFGRFHLNTDADEKLRGIDDLWIKRAGMYSELSTLQGTALREKVNAENVRLIDEAIARVEKETQALEENAEAWKRAIEAWDAGEFERRTSASDDRIDRDVEAQAAAARARLDEMEVAEELAKKEKEEAEARDKLVDGYETQAAKVAVLARASTEYARRLLELRLEHHEFMRSLGPDATLDQRDRAAAAYKQRVDALNQDFSLQQQEEERGRERMPGPDSPYRDWRLAVGSIDPGASGLRRGTAVAGAILEDLNQELARALLTKQADFARIADAFKSTLVNAFVSSLTEAAFQKPMEALFSSFFASLSGAAAGATGAGAGADAGFGSGTSSLVLAPTSAPPALHSPLESLELHTEVRVVGDEMALKTSRRGKESFVSAAMSRPGVRGYRSPP